MQVSKMADADNRLEKPPITGSADRHLRIGDVLRRDALITDFQCMEIARYAESLRLRFGEAAIALGLIKENDLERALAVQFDMGLPDDSFGGEPVAFTLPRSQAAEDYRSIRNALVLRWFKHPQGAKTLAVISAGRKDGRSVMAANLAVCMAQVGYRTLLIDADMRSPRQHLLFDLNDRMGLSTYLAGHSGEGAFHEIGAIPSLSVMPVGGIPPNPQELLLRPGLPRLIEQAREQFEMILFDTPAAEAGSDYQIIGAHAVGALMVTHRERTRTRTAKKLLAHCRDFGIRVVGSAMTGAD